MVTQLDGFRGSAVLDRQALRDLILRFALLLREVPEIVEADLNSVRCLTDGCVVLDMRLRIAPYHPAERAKDLVNGHGHAGSSRSSLLRNAGG